MTDWQKLKAEILNCQRCPLYKTRIHPVVGEGNLQARIMLIGEAPGANEDKTGRPFCGAAGKILDELLAFVDIKRKDIYIANILKCRPPGNRPPQTLEIKACTPFLERQIEMIKPEIISPLGNFAARFIFQKFGLEDKILGISKIHGQVFEGGDLFHQVKIVPLYHPAVAVYNIRMLPVLKDDMEKLSSLLKNEK